jgi:hypothetical protein
MMMMMKKKKKSWMRLSADGRCGLSGDALRLQLQGGPPLLPPRQRGDKVRENKEPRRGVGR